MRKPAIELDKKAKQQQKQMQKQKKKKKLASEEPTTRSVKPLPPHKYVLAPMVGGSELAFRLLCRRYAARSLLCYTPMMDSGRFASEAAYREELFQTCAADRPLVAHFSGNDPATLLAAARLVEDQVDAVDLNLGCPQRVAYVGHFGSFLLDEVDRPLILDIVRTLSRGLTVPVFCKVRLLATTEMTIELCAALRDAGAALIAIHARHRVNLVNRTGPSARDGPALLDEVAKVRSAVPGVQLLSNGNVKTWEDVCANLAHTGADGIMSAEGILDDPALFLPSMADDAPEHGEAEHGATEHGAATSAATVGGLEGGGRAGLAEEGARKERRLRKKLREAVRLEAKAAAGQLSDEEQAKVASRHRLERCAYTYTCTLHMHMHTEGGLAGDGTRVEL